MPRLLILLLVLLCGGSIRAAGQEAHPPQSTDQGRPTHGIIRKPQPKPPAQGTNAATAQPGKTEPGKATPTTNERAKTAPSASTEAVAAAIANAVRSLEEREKKKAEPLRPQPARNAQRAARAVPQRRYSVAWPAQRFTVEWAAPVDRVTLSWSQEVAAAQHPRDDMRLEP
jgi:hypothetical protein